MAAEVPTHERECAVCTNEFNTPKILPCGHLLCRQCVISWMDSKSDARCPLCTCPIVEHQGHSSQSSVYVTDALPTEYVMEAIVESARVLVKDDMCTVCDDVRAEYICMQCLEKMCLSCMKIHKKMVATRSHDVESLSTVTPERLAASRPALCADHGDKQGERFCADHNLVICTSCDSNKHSKCPDVKYLDETMKSAEIALVSLTEELVKAEDNLKQAIGNLNVHIQTVDATEEEKMALVDKTCDRLQKMVEECRKQVKDLINSSISKFKKSLYDVKRELEKRLGKVTSHKHLVTRATAIRPCPALIHAAKALTDRVHNLNLRANLKPESWVYSSPNVAKCFDDVENVIKAELQSMEQQQTDAKLEALEPVLVFHENCGTNIRLINGRKTARLVDPEIFGNGVVVSRDPMIVNVLYEVTIDEIDTLARNMMFLGVTGILSAALTVMRWSENLEESVIIWHTGVRRKGYTLKSNIGNALNCIKVGSRVGVLVDSSNDLHLYVDGHDKGVAAKDVTQPSFAVFELRIKVIQVTALPTTTITESM